MKNVTVYKEFTISHADIEFDSVAEGDDWVINAYDKEGKVVGYLRVYREAQLYRGGLIAPSKLFVEEAYRRRGIATAMYMHAEKYTGAVAISGEAQVKDPSHTSALARLMWNQKDRPFGNRLDK